MQENIDITQKKFNAVAMLNGVRRLSVLLEQEIEMLKNMQIANIYQLYDTKIELTEELESYKQMLANNPNLISGIPQNVLNNLRAETEKFEGLLLEENKQIARANEVHKIVMDSIKKVVEKSVAMSSGYNRKGVIDIGNKNTYVTPSVTLNENI